MILIPTRLLWFNITIGGLVYLSSRGCSLIGLTASNPALSYLSICERPPQLPKAPPAASLPPFPPAFNREADGLLRARYAAHECAFRDATIVCRRSAVELIQTYTQGTQETGYLRRACPSERSLRQYGAEGDAGVWQEGRSSKSNWHSAQKWRSTTQSATASTKRPPMPGARCTGTADPVPWAEEGAKEACLADWHSLQGGSLYSRSAFYFWPAWQDSAPDFSPWSGSRASSTSLIHGKLANVCQVRLMLS